MAKRSWWAVGLAWAAVVWAAEPTEIVEQVAEGTGTINWTTGMMTAVGWGPRQPKAPPGLEKIWQRRVAMVDAQRHLAETVRGVKVTSETTVKMYELVDDKIDTGVSAFLKGFQVVEDGLNEDGVWVIKLALPLVPRGDEHTALAEVVLKQIDTAQDARVQTEAREINAKQAPDEQFVVPPARKVDIPEEQPAPAQEHPARQPGPYTGLIVDTTGFKVERALAPKIVDREEDVVWGNVAVDRDTVLETGIVGYAPSLAVALDPDRSRAGKNPLIIRAIGKAGSFRANAVITGEDAELILKENKESKFLDKFKVVFVIDA